MAKQIEMKIRFLTKINAHKRFDYAPRYYDERKARIESIASKYDDSVEIDETRRQEMMRQSIADNWGRGVSRQKHKSSSNARFFVILVILAFLIYLVFSSGESFNTIVETLD